MRSYAFLLLAALGLSGCTFSVTDTPLKGGAKLVPHTTNVVMSIHSAAPVPVLEHHDAIDLTTVLQTATSIPQHIESLERAVVVWGIVLAVVGVANALLLVRLIASRSRVVTAVAAQGSVPAASCACGAAISARTKTGRCRPCALEYRAKKRAAETRPVHVPSRNGLN
jgi:hypothetical protein